MSEKGEGQKNLPHDYDDVGGAEVLEKPRHTFTELIRESLGTNLRKAAFLTFGSLALSFVSPAGAGEPEVLTAHTDEISGEFTGPEKTPFHLATLDRFVAEPIHELSSHDRERFEGFLQMARTYEAPVKDEARLGVIINQALQVPFIKDLLKLVPEKKLTVHQATHLIRLMIARLPYNPQIAERLQAISLPGEIAADTQPKKRERLTAESTEAARKLYQESGPVEDILERNQAIICGHATGIAQVLYTYLVKHDMIDGESLLAQLAGPAPDLIDVPGIGHAQNMLLVLKRFPDWQEALGVEGAIVDFTPRLDPNESLATAIEQARQMPSPTAEHGHVETLITLMEVATGLASLRTAGAVSPASYLQCGQTMIDSIVRECPDGYEQLHMIHNIVKRLYLPGLTPNEEHFLANMVFWLLDNATHAYEMSQEPQVFQTLMRFLGEGVALGSLSFTLDRSVTTPSLKLDFNNPSRILGGYVNLDHEPTIEGIVEQTSEAIERVGTEEQKIRFRQRFGAYLKRAAQQ